MQNVLSLMPQNKPALEVKIACATDFKTGILGKTDYYIVILGVKGFCEIQIDNHD